jgi:O-antigen ligase
MKPLNFFIFFLILIVFFAGGVGFENLLTEIVGVGLGIFLLLVVFFSSKRIEIPKGFSLYVAFLGFLCVSELLRKNLDAGLEYILLFTGGGLFWVSFYNLKEQTSKSLVYLILLLGGLFFVGAAWYQAFDQSWSSPWGLIGPYTDVHHHLGDYFLIVVLAVLWFMRRKTKLWHAATLILASVVLFYSFSRSAYVGAFGAILFLIYKGYFLKGRSKKKIVLGLLLVLGLIFISSAFLKETLFARPFFPQAILGIADNPLGIGMGNFTQISRNPAYHIWGMTGFSEIVHNIFLEVFVGTGIVGGVIFVLWFFKSTKGLFATKDDLTLFYCASFIGLTLNFLFDSTYLVPTLVWLWFVFLGFAQK